LDDIGHCRIFRIFIHACPYAVPTLNASGFIDSNPVNPQSSIGFFGGMIWVYENRCTFSTARTFIDINVSGISTDPYLEVSFFPVDIFYVCAGMDFNIDMPADLDQFRRDNSHSTIIGGKGLV
jgi:hypothetical protein